MSNPPPERRALLWMSLGAAIIGSNGLLVRIAGVPPTVSAFWRMLLAGLLLSLLLLATGRWRRLSRRAWLWCLVPATAFAADLWLWHRSILLVGPGLATLLANAQVFFMALAGLLLFGERLGPRFLLGLALAAFGLWLMLGDGWDRLPDGYRLGVWLGLATGLCYAAYSLGLRRAQHEALSGSGEADAPVGQVLAIAAFGSAAILGVAVAAEGADVAIPSPSAFAILLLLAGFGHCLSWVLISRAMPHLKVAAIGLMLLLQPVVAFLLDAWLLDRATRPHEWLGLACSLAGIFLANLKSRARIPPA